MLHSPRHLHFVKVHSYGGEVLPAAHGEEEGAGGAGDICAYSLHKFPPTGSLASKSSLRRG